MNNTTWTCTQAWVMVLWLWLMTTRSLWVFVGLSQFVSLHLCHKNVWNQLQTFLACNLKQSYRYKFQVFMFRCNEVSAKGCARIQNESRKVWGHLMDIWRIILNGPGRRLGLWSEPSIRYILITAPPQGEVLKCPIYSTNYTKFIESNAGEY